MNHPPVRTESTIERSVLGAVVVGWIVVLASVTAHPLFVSHDSISNNAHVWYVSEQLWHGHGLPLHMPMLADGKALAYPYAFIPWTSAALLRPLLGEWVVTLWLVGAFVVLLVLVLWSLPELRRGWLVAAVLVNPALVMALLAGQIPFIWATAMLFAAIGAWRRERRWTATVLAGLGMATHVAVVAPIAVLLVAVYLRSARDRRSVVVHFVVAALIAAPAAAMVAMSPAFEQSSTAFRVGQLLRVVATRGTVVAVPFVLIAVSKVRHRWLAPGGFAVLALFNPLSLQAMNRYAWGAPWRSPDERVVTVIESPAFVPGATYRVLGFSDGRVSMYRLIQHGAQLDGEFFPESQARRSWASVAAYGEFLRDRDVDFVMAWYSYDRRWGTNEHELLRRMEADPSCDNGPLSAQLVVADPGFELFAVGPCRPA